MHARTYKEGCMAAAVRGRVSRTLDWRGSRSSTGGGGGGARAGLAAAGCFSVYVGAGRERFVVPVARANHRLFRRLLDDAELEYGYAAQGPLALPGCDVAAFLGVMSQIEHHDDGGGGGGDNDVFSPTMCGLIPRSCGTNGGRLAARRQGTGR
ncbi:uncharacterized protein C2845_PM18G03020 [Panicum miliaceum]|uniref:Uncharacterized protein n=1 Tax=Panicum miliaceum TaxID=4540 RepID=A0A3L6PIY7_PANMI|nr:uncharacterized protein C2845_PM18G03020 [Panicum miliaceum]